MSLLRPAVPGRRAGATERLAAVGSKKIDRKGAEKLAACGPLPDKWAEAGFDDSLWPVHRQAPACRRSPSAATGTLRRGCTLGEPLPAGQIQRDRPGGSESAQSDVKIPRCAVVYLNGKEVCAKRHAGPRDHACHAGFALSAGAPMPRRPAAQFGALTARWARWPPAQALRKGTKVLAMELHASIIRR